MSKPPLNRRSSKGAIRKELVRNVEIPITSKGYRRPTITKVSVSTRPATENKENNNRVQLLQEEEARQDRVMPQKRCTSKFKQPELNTTLELAKTLEKLKTITPKRLTNESELTPRSKAIVVQEVTKRLNFHPNTEIYKNLIPINVNDSLLIPADRKPLRKKYQFKRSTDPVPELSDFLTPIKPWKVILPLPPIYSYNSTFLKNSESDGIKRCFDQILELHLNHHPDEQ